MLIISIFINVSTYLFSSFNLQIVSILLFITQLPIFGLHAFILIKNRKHEDNNKDKNLTSGMFSFYKNILPDATKKYSYLIWISIIYATFNFIIVSLKFGNENTLIIENSILRVISAYCISYNVLSVLYFLGLKKKNNVF
ncbi:MAG: hypothetical protein FWD47_05685 [Treponema sp.]|nr:hypothetical protein [Treponema sp.]